MQTETPSHGFDACAQADRACPCESACTCQQAKADLLNLTTPLAVLLARLSIWAMLCQLLLQDEGQYSQTFCL